MASGNILTFYAKKTGYLYMSYYASDDRVDKPTGLKVVKAEFDAGKITKPHRALMDRLRQVVANHEGACLLASRPVLKADVASLLQEALGRPARKSLGNTFGPMFNRYRLMVERGEILKDGDRFSDAWITSAKAVEKLIQGTPLAEVPASDIRETHLAAFVSLLTTKGYARNTVTTYQSIVVGMINATRRLEWHKAAILDPKAYRVSWEKIDHKVYVKKSELKHMLTLPYKGKYALWRDLFVLGCRLGLRNSDFLRLTNEHLIGGNININTKKTGAPVWVPLVPMAKAIWDKYKGDFRVPDEDRFRRFIRKLGEDAGLDKPVLFRRTEGGKKVEEWSKTYELMGTHTMRRSFATNAYLDGVPMPSIMKVTGHKSISSFLKYVCLTDEEHAGVLARHEKFGSDD